MRAEAFGEVVGQLRLGQVVDPLIKVRTDAPDGLVMLAFPHDWLQNHSNVPVGLFRDFSAQRR